MILAVEPRVSTEEETRHTSNVENVTIVNWKSHAFKLPSSLKNTHVWYGPKLIYGINILDSQLIIEPSLNLKEPKL